MSTLFVSLSISVIIILVYYFLHKSDKSSQKKEITELMKGFHNSCDKNSLNINEIEKLRSVIIGLDKSTRKIIIKFDDKSYSELKILSIDDLIKCYTERLYQTNKFGKNKKNGETILESIVLRIKLKDNEQIDIPFFKNSYNSIYELPELERKVGLWEGSISRLIASKSKSN